MLPNKKLLLLLLLINDNYDFVRYFDRFNYKENFCISLHIFVASGAFKTEKNRISGGINTID